MGEVLGVFGVNVKLLIVQMINFALMLVILWYVLYRPVIALLKERQAKIEKGVIDAETAEKHLSEVSRQKGEILSSATKEAEGIVAGAVNRGGEREQEIMAEANKKSERLLREAAERAAEEQRKLLLDTQEEIAQMAVLGAEKILLQQTK